MKKLASGLKESVLFKTSKKYNQVLIYLTYFTVLISTLILLVYISLAYSFIIKTDDLVCNNFCMVLDGKKDLRTAITLGEIDNNKICLCIEADTDTVTHSKAGPFRLAAGGIYYVPIKK